MYFMNVHRMAVMSTFPPSIAPPRPHVPSPSEQPPSLSTTTSAPPDLTPSQTNAISSLTSLLHQPLRITIIDKRTFIGTFICVDPGCNIILSNAEEFRPEPTTQEEREIRENRDMYWPRSRRGPGEGEGWGGRQLGMVLVPGKVVVKVEVEEGWEMRGTEVI